MPLPFGVNARPSKVHVPLMGSAVLDSAGRSRWLASVGSRALHPLPGDTRSRLPVTSPLQSLAGWDSAPWTEVRFARSTDLGLLRSSQIGGYRLSADLRCLPSRPASCSVLPTAPLPRSWFVLQGLTDLTSDVLVRRPGFDLFVSRRWPLPFSPGSLPGPFYGPEMLPS